MNLYDIFNSIDNLNQNGYDLNINELSIRIFTSEYDDIIYLNNFLLVSDERTNNKPKYYLHMKAIDSSIKEYISNLLDNKIDEKIMNHITDFHYCHQYNAANEQVNIYYNEKKNYFIVRRQNSFYILYDYVCKKRSSLSLYVIRELIYRECENSGSICLHAASCRIENKGIILVGAPGAGKTGLLLALVEENNAIFISNDRILIDHNLRLTSIPMPIRISVESIKSSRVLHNFIMNNSKMLCRKQNIQIEEIARFDSKSNKDKIELSPLEISKCFSTNCLNTSSLDAIIIPEFNSQHGDFIEISTIDKEVAKNYLRQNCYTPQDPLWIEPWFGRKEIAKDLIFSKLDRILAAVPIYKIKFGVGVHSALKNGNIQWIK